MKNKQRILIFGASGFIGRHTVALLSKSGCDVYAQCMPGEELAPIPGVIWFSCDLREGLCENFLPPVCDSVIYLAQSPEFRKFPDGAESVFAINVAGVFRSIEYARKVGARRFIFASTGSVYDLNGKPLHEEDLIDVATNKGFYAASKLAAELVIRPYAECMSVIILRLFMPYGTGLNSSMLLSDLVYRIRSQIPIDLHGEEGMRINPIYIDDVTRLVERCIEYDNSITLNVAGAEAASLREVGLIIGNVLGVSPVFNVKQTPAPVMIGDITTMKHNLGFTPKTPMKEGFSLWLKSASPK